MLETIADAIRSARSLLLVSHERPDGDALGSVLALYHALQGLNKSAVAYIRDEIPSIYRFLPGSEVIKHTLESVEAFDAAVLLDCSDLQRIGGEANRIGSIGTLIAIDHHLSNDGSIPLSLVDREASSTGELLMGLIDELKVPLSADIAMNIYTAVMTDTGSFRYSNTTEATFALASRLAAAGADPRKAAEQVYEARSLVSLRLIRRALDSLCIEAAGDVGSIVLNRRDMEEEGALPEHAEGLVELVRSVEGIRVALFYYEMPDGTYKISMRSKGSVDVERAAKTLGGGGHRNAAACRMAGELDGIRKRVMDAVAVTLQERQR